MVGATHSVVFVPNKGRAVMEVNKDRVGCCAVASFASSAPAFWFPPPHPPHYILIPLKVLNLPV